MGIYKIFELICELKPFKNQEILKNASFEEQILIMLQHIEFQVNNLLSKDDFFKNNPIYSKKYMNITLQLEKDNRAKKARENKLQVMEDHKLMIERVNYKFFRLNVLPK